MGRVVNLIALSGVGLSILMAVSLFSVRSAGYHVSGLGGWVFAAIGWGLAVVLSRGKEGEEDVEPYDW